MMKRRSVTVTRLHFMKLLSQEEADEQKAQENFENQIRDTCRAFCRGLLDRQKLAGYHGWNLSNTTLETAYSIGWNYDFSKPL
jgi:hypothetical protein